jgi:hypothetical protein
VENLEAWAKARGEDRALDVAEDYVAACKRGEGLSLSDKTWAQPAIRRLLAWAKTQPR